ncbi:hypothetical protein E9529_15755 [Blastococcus sp. KM273128]|uniref:hypothetical protein n=1 Tax=Blastococcus sp. KM273128 TaxID=2570314 RepID=UPI001F3CD00C|nr:hypothetical protein [Blastococcus sp. KM273128]MCF6745702.1 hypothetical protein [Blastococcus sp. KM273128]
MWLKISDDFPARAAEAALSDAAVRTHIDALCAIMHRETGPILNRRDLRRFLESDDADQAVTELVAAGWWVRQDDGTVRVLENMGDQPEPEVMAKRRAAAAERQRRKRLLDNGIDPDTGENLTPEQVKAKRRREDRTTPADTPSRRDTPPPSRRESRGYPGRDGSGRDGALRTGPPTDVEPDDDNHPNPSPLPPSVTSTPSEPDWPDWPQTPCTTTGHSGCGRLDCGDCREGAA